MAWHCAIEGPWWKRLRIRLFGLTAKEWAENLESLAEMQAKIRARAEQEDREFDEWWEREGKYEPMPPWTATSV